MVGVVQQIHVCLFPRDILHTCVMYHEHFLLLDTYKHEQEALGN